MKVLEVAFTCYAVSDMPRARAFYEGMLGLNPGMVHESDHGSWVEYEIGPHTLSLGRADAFKPSSDGCSAALEVEDFDSAIAELKAANVKFRIEPMPTPVCHMAMIFDPDGNSLCIHKRRPASELAR